MSRNMYIFKVLPSIAKSFIFAASFSSGKLVILCQTPGSMFIENLILVETNDGKLG